MRSTRSTTSGRGRVAGTDAEWVTLAIALFTVAFKVVLTAVTRRIGRQTKNPAVFALAYDHRNDIFAAAAASLGIFLGRMGYPLDGPARRRTGGPRHPAHGGGDPARVLEGPDGHPARPRAPRPDRGGDKDIPGVEQVEEILAHRFGPSLVVNVTIGIDGSLSVAEGDRIATRVEHILGDEIDFLERVHVHYHPAREGVPRSGGLTSSRLFPLT